MTENSAEGGKTEVVLNVVTSIPIEGRVTLSAGDRLRGNVDIIPTENTPSTCSIKISKIIKQPNEIKKEVVYESGDIIQQRHTLPFQLSFQAPEDGEYAIEVNLVWQKRRAYVRAELYLETEC